MKNETKKIVIDANSLIVIDANSLIPLLLIICAISEKENSTTKHCEKQIEEHFRYFLQSLGKGKIYKHITRMIKNIIVTPQILAETYNVLETQYDIKDKRQKEFWGFVTDFIKKIREECVKKEDIINEKAFRKYGFADISVYFIAKKLKEENKEYNCILITDDTRLKGLGEKDLLVNTMEDIFLEWVDEESYFKS